MANTTPKGARPASSWTPSTAWATISILSRRLVGDIAFKINYSFYDIKDYIASNQTFANNSGPGAGAQRFSRDDQINLEEVWRHGIDVEAATC
ncbi:MAG: hypothetical protein U5J82_05290 [Desulfobacterales bacterium]|nr:hypothetical protein [Desulfobacterales bacterium]